MKVDVLHAECGLGDEVLVGGPQDVVVTAENAPLLAGAAAAGALNIVEASDEERSLLDGHVQAQEDGEAAYAAAQADGTWREGNELQYALEHPDEIREVSEV